MISPNAKNRLALALDNFSEKEKIVSLVKATKEYVGVFKIGLEQYVRFGPSIVQEIKRERVRVFLDLKLHDIPNTVAKAVIAASEHGVDLLTIHTIGGFEMMKAAADAVKTVQKAPKLVGVTILTSIDTRMLNTEMNIPGSVSDQVVHLAKMAVSAGLNGIVCSAEELSAVKQHLPAEFEVITPGIRPAGSSANDQKRTATPHEAIKNGATLLVVGRPITQAADPQKAAQEIVVEIGK